MSDLDRTSEDIVRTEYNPRQPRNGHQLRFGHTTVNMDRTKILELILASVLMIQQAQCDDVISGLVKIATCRATCDPRDQSCWDTCHILANVKDTSDVCEDITCNAVCQAVCRHYMLNNATPGRRNHPKDVKTRDNYQFARMPKMHGCSLSWSPLSGASNTLYSEHSIPGSVYLIIGQDRAGQWYEVTQTSSTFTVIPSHMSTKMSRIIILGVREDGVHDSVIIETSGVDCQLEERRQALKESKETLDVNLTPIVTSVVDVDNTFLTEVTLSWTGVVDDCPRYLIQWQKIPESVDIVGNMVTSHTGVTLTLDTDAMYVVTVRDINTRTVSPPTIINTSSSSSSLSVEILILIILTIISVSAFLVIYICRRITKQNIEVNQNEINKQFEIISNGNIECLKVREVTESSEKWYYLHRLMVLCQFCIENIKIILRRRNQSPEVAETTV